MYGTRTSLLVAVSAVGMGVSAGVLLGLIAVMRGGWVENGDHAGR